MRPITEARRKYRMQQERKALIKQYLEEGLSAEDLSSWIEDQIDEEERIRLEEGLANGWIHN